MMRRPSLAIDSKKEMLLWIGMGIFSLVFFLFLTFPFNALQSRILMEITRTTGWEVRASDWSVGLPVAIEWHDLLLSKTGTGSIPVESMRMSVGLLAQLMGRFTLDARIYFPGSAPSGTARITGTLTASSRSFQGPVTVQSHFQQIDLAQLLKPYVTKGLLQADVMQSWIGNAGGAVTFKGDGSWKAEIKDLTLERIPMGQTHFPSLTFNRVTFALTCHDALCNITELKGDGLDGSIDGQGQLRLQQPIQQSAIELTVTVLAGPGWAQKSAGLPLPPLQPGSPLTFKLIGSVANPRLSV
ncbi:MAG TPA: type II secretion system protein GspN [Nitrospira sp.]